MAELTIVHARVCATCVEWATLVEGSKGETYRVSFGYAVTGPYERDYACTCAGFRYRPTKPCKHILQVCTDRCGWGAEAFSGTFSEPNPDGSCPDCGGPTVVVKVGV